MPCLVSLLSGTEAAKSGETKEPGKAAQPFTLKRTTRDGDQMPLADAACVHTLWSIEAALSLSAFLLCVL